MRKKKPFQVINKKGKKISTIWKYLSKKYNLPIEILSIPSLISFKFKLKNNEIYKKIITKEMLRYGFLASTKVYVCMAHTDKIIKKYSFYMDRVFKKIKEFEDGRPLKIQG